MNYLTLYDHLVKIMRLKWMKHLLFLVAVFFSMQVTGQSLEDFQDAAESGGNTLIEIFTIILRVIMALGLVGVIYLYSTNNQRAKEAMIAYCIAAVIYGAYEMFT